MKPLYGQIGWRDTYHRKGIDDLVAHYERGRRMMRDMTMPEGCTFTAAERMEIDARHAAQIAAGHEEQSRLHRLFDEQDAVFQRWDVESGHKAADDEADCRWDIKMTIEDQILAYRCGTLDDVQAKAAFTVGEFGDEFSVEAANKLIAGPAS